MPSALEQLHSAKIFTKLVLHSAYKLVCLGWVMTEIRPSEPPPPILNTVSCYMGFPVLQVSVGANNMLRDILGKFVMAYIDPDILTNLSWAQSKVPKALPLVTRICWSWSHITIKFTFDLPVAHRNKAFLVIIYWSPYVSAPCSDSLQLSKLPKSFSTKFSQF